MNTPIGREAKGRYSLTVDLRDALDEVTINRVLGAALAAGADFAEIFAEDAERSSVHFDDGRIETLASSRDVGVGIRVITGTRTGFAHTADLGIDSLLRAARAAAEAARGTGPARSVAVTSTTVTSAR
ncbi:MAG: hypothetical protein O3C27_02630, partial [Actinomycetota bacterium]|nr:hypothetical protein [Actinomycetota bacterium]